MVRNLVDGRYLSARAAFIIGIAWLVGVIMAAAYMNYRDRPAAIATPISNATGQRRTVSADALPLRTSGVVRAYDPSSYPTVASAIRTLHAEQLATAPKHYGCLTLPTTITTASWGPITFACAVGVTYKTSFHHHSARRAHVSVARTIALHPGVMHLGDYIRYELVPSR